MATMQAGERQMIETAKQSILLTLFNKLDDHDKDAVIQLSESLVAKYRNDNESCKVTTQKNCEE
jgi:hypothetical protein